MGGAALPEGWETEDVWLDGSPLHYKGPCPTCGAALGGEEPPADIIARHGRNRHIPRQFRQGRHFPDDAVVTVGNGKAQYKLGQQWAFGEISLTSLSSGRNLSAPLEKIRWDGETFHTRSGWRTLVYRERPELLGSHGLEAERQ